LLAAAVTVVFTMMTMGYARETARRAGNEGGGGWLIHDCLTFQEKFVDKGCPAASEETP
jgi:cytochrome bd ubiquinol oxidase subunit I